MSKIFLTEAKLQKIIIEATKQILKEANINEFFDAVPPPDNNQTTATEYSMQKQEESQSQSLNIDLQTIVDDFIRLSKTSKAEIPALVKQYQKKLTLPEYLIVYGALDNWSENQIIPTIQNKLQKPFDEEDYHAAIQTLHKKLQVNTISPFKLK